MKEKIKNKFLRWGMFLCTLAITITTLTLNDCYRNWYQEEEPEGLTEFLNNKNL